MANTNLQDLADALKSTKNMKVSSSELNQCSVRVHDNPLLSDLLVGGRLRSDLEFALQKNDQQVIQALLNTERKPVYGDAALPRHMSPSDYQDVIEDCDANLKDINDYVDSKSNETTNNAE